jgi:CcmD family protein
VSQPAAAPSTSTAADRATTYQSAPSGEAVSGGPLLVAAYAFVWVIVLLAVARVFMRQSDVSKKIEDLERQIEKKKPS